MLRSFIQLCRCQAMESAPKDRTHQTPGSLSDTTFDRASLKVFFKELILLLMKWQTEFKLADDPEDSILSSVDSCLSKDEGVVSLTHEDAVRAGQLENEIQCLKSKLLEMEKQLLDVVEKNKDWQTYDAQRSAYVESLQRKLSGMTTQNDIAEVKEKQMSGFIEQYKHRAAVSEEERDKLHKENQRLRDEQTELRQQALEQEKLILWLRCQLDQIKDDTEAISTLEMQMQQCAQDFVAERSDKVEVQEELKKLNAELDAVKKELESTSCSNPRFYSRSQSPKHAKSCREEFSSYAQRRGGSEHFLDSTDGADDVGAPLDDIQLAESHHGGNDVIRCPRCEKRFDSSHHYAFLDHIDVCCD